MVLSSWFLEKVIFYFILEWVPECSRSECIEGQFSMEFVHGFAPPLAPRCEMFASLSFAALRSRTQRSQNKMRKSQKSGKQQLSAFLTFSHSFPESTGSPSVVRFHICEANMKMNGVEGRCPSVERPFCDCSESRGGAHPWSDLSVIARSRGAVPILGATFL